MWISALLHVDKLGAKSLLKCNYEPLSEKTSKLKVNMNPSKRKMKFVPACPQYIAAMKRL